MACSEFELIKHYFSQQALSRDDVLLGIGDDAAVMQLANNEQLVITTDTLVAGVHFPETTAPYDIGYKLLAVNLSDLAAMGATPRWASLALTLPESDENWLAQFVAGFFELAQRYNVALVGGDTTRGPLTLSVSLQGSVVAGQCLRRQGAQIGDAILVSGYLGDAGMALQQLLAGQRVETQCLARLNRPTPRVELGLSLQGVATAAIDISDGLLADLGHILTASQLGAVIDLENLPLSSTVSAQVNNSDWSLPLTAGDDYELCFTVPESRLAELDHQHCPITRIGTIVDTPGIECVSASGQVLELAPMGYQHFK